jgi:hypothetical protein
MTSSESRGIDRRGLDQAFSAEEKRKSELILKAQLLRAQDRDEAAAASLAEAARLEERLSERCLAAGLREKAWVHRFSAASCWAQAGNFYQAIAWCDDLLGQAGLTDSLRQRVESYVQQLRARRARWYADLATANAASEHSSP